MNEVKEKAKDFLDKISDRLTHLESTQIKECALVIIDEILKLEVSEVEALDWENIKLEIEKS
jgi:hypothetical protein